MSQSRQYCTFRIGPLLLGIDVLDVQEVLRPRELTAVPLAPHAVEGLLNLRGQIVTAIDLRRRLHISAPAPADGGTVIVVRLVDGVAAFLADEIGDVLEVDSATFELPPETLTARVNTLIVGVHKLPNQLLHVIDAAQCAVLTTSSSQPALA